MKDKNINYINNKLSNASKILEYYFFNYISKVNKNFDEIVFVCIGTSKFAGDCLGPLVGNNLKKSLDNLNFIKIYGTLENQLTAKNLNDYIKKITLKHKNSLIIAIDSSLGKRQNIGYLKVGSSNIKPGSCVGKNLPCIGDIFITGIVNLKSNLPKLSIKNTHISLVVNMAENISTAIIDTIKKVM